MTRVVGVLLLVASVGVFLVGGAWLLTANFAQGLSLDATVLGFGLLVLVAGVLAGGGLLVLWRGRSEQAEQVKAERLRKILDIVQTRGQVKLSDIIIELHSSLPDVQNMVYELVGMGVFSGYVNWDEGVLYSAEGSALRETTQCKHCGGSLTLAGKGVLKCPFCGTEYFLS